jgi:hypothetical protein
MADRTIRDQLGAGIPSWPGALPPDVRPTWLARVRASLFADRYDREVEACVTATPGSPISVHGARLTSAHERAVLSATLRTVMSDALVGDRGTRIPVQEAAVRRSADVISAILDRLESPQPARVRGMARLRMLLSDGRGPLYRTGSGSLAAALRGVLAAL